MSTGTLIPDSPPRLSRMAVLAKWLGISALAAPLSALVVLMAGGRGGALLSFLLLTMLLVVASVTLAFVAKTRIGRNPHLSGVEAADTGFKSGVGGLVLFIVVVLFTPPPGHGVSSNESSAVGSLRTINTAEVTYATTYPKVGFSSSLEVLGGAVPCDASSTSACLVDQALASGRRSGYVLTYTPGPPDAEGVITSYTAIARPMVFGKSGQRSFFTDQTGVIRATQEDRAPTVQDPPLQ